MSGLFKSTTIKGNRLTEFAQTTATVGNTIPFGWGRFVSPCNIIWADLPPKEQRRRQRVGKGGTKQETYTYLMSYAVGVCKGPVAGFWWIKRNGKVVYTRDPAAPVEDKAYAAKWQQRVSFYFGLPGQLPDGTIEAVEGVGQVSAFPGTAYFVVENEDVTDTGGAPPSYEVCVIADGVAYATSPPYTVENIEDVSTVAAAAAVQSISPPYESPAVGVGAQAAQLEVRLMRVAESVDAGQTIATATPASIEVLLMRQTQTALAGEVATAATAAQIDVEKIRVVIDRHQPQDFAAGCAPTLIEVTL